MTERFAGRVALVTGGGLGIGRAAAVAFARDGAKVVIADVLEDESAETVETIAAAGGEAVFQRTDVSRADDVAAAVDRAVDTFGRLDYAFNNAGVGGRSANVRATAEFDEAEFDEYIAVNLKGVWLSMKYEIRQMLAQGGGAIVNMSSGAGLVGVKNLGPYCASKHGVMGLTKVAALEYAAQGIRVNAVCPGVILTERIRGEFEESPELEAVRHAAHPIGRMGETREVADAVLWLCSDEASFVVGHGLAVDGGYVVP